MHVLTLWSLFFFRNPIILLCSGEIQTQTKRSVFKDKTQSLADGIPPALQPALFLVLVFTWFGLACFSSTKTIWDSNQNASAQVVFFQSNQLKSGAVMNQTKPNTSGCEPEKKDLIYICPIGLYGETLQARCFCLCDAASAPSETESANTDNHTGADDKSPCCGPLWWVLLSN